ncbi:MAG: asparagine synthase B, partial [Acidobacteriota bacterium]
MCSILALLDLIADPATLRPLALDLSRRQRHRGPDWSGIYADDRALLAHERLSIVDINGGAQPLRSADGRLILAVNGEIYNHRELRERFAAYPFQTGSDCEVILALYEHYGPENAAEWLNELDGIFAFVLWDTTAGRYLVGRDPIGVIPLFWGRDDDGQLVIASEMKSLHDVCRRFEPFPPGHFASAIAGDATARADATAPYYQPAWRDRKVTVGVEA